jgi:tRNA pseudouridine55 synthase
MLRGFINVDKPQGITSFEVVRQIRRAAGTRKVGHAGTLDPNATGVLPIALGEATRLVDELVDARKRYTAEITFGTATDTYDVEGAVTETHDASHLAEADVRDALAGFVGELAQRPPAYSAVKRDGVAAYRAARAGNPLDLEARPVVVYSIDLLSFDLAAAGGPVACVDVRCGKGFYVRSLAHEVGQQLGVGAHLSALRRTQVGPFTAEDATPLDAAVRLLEAGEVGRLVHAPDLVLDRWPAIVAGRDAVARLRRGMDIVAMPRRGYERGDRGPRVRCYGPDGALVALLEPGRAVGTWHPFRVFSAAAQADDDDDRY